MNKYLKLSHSVSVVISIPVLYHIWPIACWTPATDWFDLDWFVPAKIKITVVYVHSIESPTEDGCLEMFRMVATSLYGAKRPYNYVIMADIHH